MPAKLAIVPAIIGLLQIVMAYAENPSMSGAEYRFEIRPSLEKLNLADSLKRFGAPCAFTLRKSDGSISRVVVFSTPLAEYLAGLQTPSVTLTFKTGDHRLDELATIHGKRLEDFTKGMYLIREEDSYGKVLPDVSACLFGLDTRVCH